MKRTVGASWMVRLGLAVALVALALLTALPIIPPNPLPESAPKTTFSAQRAMEDLRVVAREPHPIGSAEQERVRDYTLGQAQTLGLSTEVQRAEVAPGRTAENVMVRIPGTANSSRDVLITAHYDSAPSAPGAGDNGVSVVAMLESMRALEAGEPLKNDIVFLFTDGEELGGPGAEAFASEHPAAHRVGVAFIFEGWPDSGPTEMRTTSPEDAWLIRQLANASPPVFTNSVYNTSDRARLGNDFAAFPPAGITSAEFLNSGSSVRYHTARDNVEAINPAVVQDHGDVMLALARHFGNLDLRQAARSAGDDLVFFTVPILGLLAYPIWLAKALAVVTAALFIAVIVAVWRLGRLTLARLALGTLAFLALLLVGCALAWGVWELLLQAHPGAELREFPDFGGSGVAVTAIFAVAAAAFVAVMYALSRRVGVLELASGALVCLATLDLALALSTPLASALALWPLLGGVTALVVVAFLGRGWAAGTLLALAAVPGFVLLVPLLVLKTVDVEDGAAVGVLILVLLLGSLLPQLLVITGRVGLGAEDRTEPKESASREQVLHSSAEGEPIHPSG